jgi:hypothetical protein
LARFSSKIIAQEALIPARLCAYLQQNDGVERICTILSVRRDNESHREKPAY